MRKLQFIVGEMLIFEEKPINTGEQTSVQCWRNGKWFKDTGKKTPVQFWRYGKWLQEKAINTGEMNFSSALEKR